MIKTPKRSRTRGRIQADYLLPGGAASRRPRGLGGVHHSFRHLLVNASRPPTSLNAALSSSCTAWLATSTLRSNAPSPPQNPPLTYANKDFNVWTQQCRRRTRPVIWSSTSMP